MFFKPETRECRRCGRSFKAKGKQHYYCSESCRREGAPKLEVICETCQRAFEVERWVYEYQGAKFCSQACYRAKRPHVERTCQSCGRHFNVKAYYAEAGWGQFCSQECQHRAYARTHREQRCSYCSNQFVVTESVLKQGGGKFCSKRCKDDAARDHVWVICVGCGQGFSISRHELNRGRGKYCSAECYKKHVDTKVVLRCEKCGESFKRHKSQIESQSHRFCSRKCYQEFVRTEGQPWYLEANDAEQYLVCVRCGKEFRASKNRKRRFCSFSCQLLYRGETSIEQAIREELESRGVSFDTQVQIGKFNVDFLLFDGKKVIECDGEYWHGLSGARARDRYKDEYLFQKGYQVFRFTESEIRNSAGECVDRVLKDSFNGKTSTN